MGKRTCSVEDCDQLVDSHSARGLCTRHYARLRRLGSTQLPTAEDRFWPKVNRGGPNGCWIWTAPPKNDGYGQFWSGSRMMRAHQFSYELLVGPVPEGLELDHLCRVPLCVNPGHLEPVIHLENVRRGIQAQKTYCKHGHPLDETNTYRTKRGRRQCRACNTLNKQTARQR